MPLLNVRTVRFDVPVYDDAGSGAREDLKTWKPTLPHGWFYLGPAANNGESNGHEGVIVQKASSTRVLAPIARWEQVWNDAGSGKPTDFSLWRGLPAEEDRVDFVVVGGFFVRSHNEPTSADALGMMAVHKDALIQASPGRQVWTDAGSKARMDGAVWGISTDGQSLEAIDTGAFVPVQGYDNPPRNTYALNRSSNALRRMYRSKCSCTSDSFWGYL